MKTTMRLTVSLPAAFSVAIASACAPQVFEGAWGIEALEDENPDPDVVEVSLVATPARLELENGTTTDVWAYNGTVPGPALVADVGQRVIVHFENELPDPTTIHWHGLRVPANMDGTEVQQSPIEPGQSFTYEFVVPDAELAWFHPHLDSARQVEMGLYAPIVIGDGSGVGEGRVMVLDDVLLEGGQIAPADAGGHMGSMQGRIGNVVLVNGHQRPVLEAPAGTTERWRLVNAANARRFRLALPGARFTLVGTDGGMLESPREIEEIDLAPGERADVIVELPSSRGDHDLMTSGGDGMMSLSGSDSVLVVRMTGGEPTSGPDVDALMQPLPDLPEPTVDRTVRFSGGMMGGGMMGGGGGFRINGESWPDVTPLEARAGDTERWVIENDTAMDHPFHLHGFRFQVEGTAGWKDTVHVPSRGKVTIRVPIDDNPGRWLFHCHILEHAEEGMMGELRVE